MRKLLIGTAAALLVTFARTEASAGDHSYDPGRGTLPTDQGFWLYDDGTSPPPTIGGGVLHQGPTEYGTYQYWYAYLPGVSFTGGGRTVVVEADLKVISSTERDAGCSRAGWSMTITDADGRGFSVWISSDAINLTGTSCDGVFKAHDATDGFHVYRLEVASGQADLWIDGDWFASAALGNPIDDFDYGGNSGVWFGDGTKLGWSETLLRGFSYSPSGGVSANRHIVSSGAGGTYELHLHPGEPFADRDYSLLGSISGQDPGIDIGPLHIPLNFDLYFLLRVRQPVQGSLDGNAEGVISMTIPPGLIPPDMSLYHAYVLSNPIDHASGALRLRAGP